MKEMIIIYVVLWHGAECIMRIFSGFLIFCNLLHEATYDNYCIVKCLWKSNAARVILLTYYLHRACLEEFNANLVQTIRSKNCKY